MGTGRVGRRWWPTGAALVGVLLGLVLLAVAFAAPPVSRPLDNLVKVGGSSPRVPASSQASGGISDSSPSARTGVPDRVTGRVLPASQPVSVAIPRLHVSSRLELLGLSADGEMEVPNDPARAGWYTLGPTPGALGPAVIAGHVTWNQKPGRLLPACRAATRRPGPSVPGRWAGRGFRGHACRPVREVKVSDATGFRGHRPRGSEAHHVRRRVRRCRAPVQRQRRRLRPADPFLSSTPSVASEDHYRHDLRASPGGRVQQADAILAEGELDVRPKAPRVGG